ncbi:hypothetical protein CRUP_010621 [Coryphaenoides rupestris]|nr:hypothetical protein CRUP_010621 [Coryphaenoides rupestris]
MGLVAWLKSQVLCHLLFGYVFLASGLLVNLLQLCTLPVWWLNKRWARIINCRLGYCVSSQSVALLDWWSGTECTLYTDPKMCPLYGKENGIVVLNHNFEIDFLCGWSFCERFGVLGSSKVLVKKELAYVPVIGWMWYFLEIVFCKRKWEEDRITMAQSLQKLHDYPENFWFLLFCEGTRFTAQKHRVSMEVAEKKGLPMLKHHLLPRTKGFWVTVQNLRGSVAALYNTMLSFRNNETPTLLGVLSGKKRIPLESIPEGEAECAAWLHKLFQERYIQTGRYPGPTLSMPRRPWPLVNWLCWSALVLYPLGLLLLSVLSSGSALKILVSVAFCTAASLLFRWMIGQTEISRSSGYGKNS